jgi:hypothetical protein
METFLSYFFLAIILFIIYIYYEGKYSDVGYVKSTIDEKLYIVRNIKDKFRLECPINYIENLNKKDYEFADKYFNDLFCNNEKVVQSVIDIFKSLISGNILRYVFFMTGEGRNG